ncbi:MAG TPA: hypothetical protein VIQ51_10360 [Chryseosolibacter sp.]
MSEKIYFPGVSILLGLLILVGCESKPAETTGFTKVDSLTETYLSLQDTVLRVWNTMIHDDNRKIKAMHHLLREIVISNPEKSEELRQYEERLDDLIELRYDQKTMSDAQLVSEYDFASNSLVTELITLAETQQDFASNSRLQNLAESIRAADQRVINYREEYDDIASRFNRFIDRNHDLLEEMQSDSIPSKKPLFQMAVE